MTVTTQFSISTSNCKHLTFAGKVKGLYDAQAPACPVCKAVLRPGELQEHMEQELAKLAQLQIRYHAHALRILCFISWQRTFPSYHRLKSLHYLRLSVCHFLAVLFSFEVIIKVDRSLSLDAPPLQFPQVVAAFFSVTCVQCLQAASLFPTYFIL